MLQFLKMQTFARKPHIFLYFARNKLVYLFLSLLVLLLDKRGVLDIFHRSSQVLIIPVNTQVYKLKKFLLLPVQTLTLKIDKDKKIEELEIQKADLLAEISRLQSIEAENSKLRRLLGANLPPNWRFEPARVISYSNDTLSVLSNFTPEKGMAAIAGENKGILVGTYHETIGKEIKITTTKNKDTRVSVIVKNSSGNKVATGLSVGEGGKIVLDQVLASQNLGQGDTITTSGDGNLPPDLLIGTVSKVIKLEGQALQKAEVSPAVDFDNLDYVFFVTKF